MPLFLSRWFQFLALKLYVRGADSHTLKDSYYNYFYLLLCYSQMEDQVVRWSVAGFPADGSWACKHRGVREREWGAWSLKCHTNDRMETHLRCMTTLHLPQTTEATWLFTTLIPHDETIPVKSPGQSLLLSCFSDRVTWLVGATSWSWRPGRRTSETLEQR